MAAAMDLRMRQLAEEGVPAPAIIGRMVGYLPELQKIWTSTTNEQLAALCREYPGFYRYAALMEEGAAKATPSYQDLPELPDSLKQQFATLLRNAAKLERGYQSALDAGARPGSAPIADMMAVHRQWSAALTRFKAALQVPTVPQKSRDMIMPTLEGMAQRIAQLEGRTQAR